MLKNNMFIYLDGDDIGNHLELLLLDGKLDEAIEFSELVTGGMSELRKSFEKIANVKVRLFGGDDLIVEFSNSPLSEIEVNQFRKDFEFKCGVTISGGLGLSVNDALSNLRRAKLSGKNRLIGKI
jgi:hypothetical protein